MSSDMLQTIAIVAQGVSAIAVIIITIYFNKAIKRIEEKRREDEEKQAIHERNQLRVEYIFIFEEYLDKVKEAQHELRLAFQKEDINLDNLDIYLNELIGLYKDNDIDNTRILNLSNQYLIQAKDMEIKNNIMELTKTFENTELLRKDIKKVSLRLEVQTLINSEQYVEPLKEIQQELEERTVPDGQIMLDITNQYLPLEVVKDKMQFIRQDLKSHLE